MKSPDLSLRGPKGTVASSQRPAGSQAAHSEFEIPSHIVPAASPPGLFPFTVLHIIENYGIFSFKNFDYPEKTLKYKHIRRISD